MMSDPNESRMKTWPLVILTICAVIFAPAYRTQAVGNAGKQDLKAEPKSLRVALHGTALQPFMGKLGIGNPAQDFRVLFDTGSSSLWVLADKCELNSGPWTNKKYARFVDRESSTYRRSEGNMAAAEYPEVNGTRFTYKLATDTLHLEDVRTPASLVEVSEQPFGAVCLISGWDSRSELQTDGVVGLRLPSKDDQNELPLYTNMAFNELVTGEPIFTFYTFGRPTTNASQQVTGELTFGGEPDKLRYSGPISWAPVTRRPGWEIRVHSMWLVESDEAQSKVGSLSPAVEASACVHGCRAQLKTGTKYIVGPREEVEKLNTRLGFVRVGDSFMAAHSCAGHEPHNLNFVFQIGPDAYLELPPQMLWFDNIVDGREHCMSTLKGQDNGSSWTLGVPFISNFYTIFDHSRERVGFARPSRARTLRD